MRAQNQASVSMELKPQQLAIPSKKTYRVWAMKVEAMLDAADLLDLVLGQADLPSESASDLKRKQRKAYNLIIGQLDDTNLGLLDQSISSKQCPQRLWHKIKEMYGEMSSDERKKAWINFYTCPSKADLGGLIAHFRLTAPFLKLMGADEAPLTEAAVAYVLAKLPESLSTLRETLCQDDSFWTVDQVLEKLEEIRPLQPVKLEPNDIVATQPMHFSQGAQCPTSQYPTFRPPEAVFVETMTACEAPSRTIRALPARDGFSQQGACAKVAQYPSFRPPEAVFVETVTACEAPSRTIRAQPQLIAQVNRYHAIEKPPRLQPTAYSGKTDERPRNVTETQNADLLAIAISRAASLDIGCESGLSRVPKYTASVSSVTSARTSDLPISLPKSALDMLLTPMKPLPRISGSVTMDVLRHEIQLSYPRVLIYCYARKPTIAALYQELFAKGPTEKVINNLGIYDSTLVDEDHLRMLKLKFKAGKRILKDDYRALIQMKRPDTSMPYQIRLSELEALHRKYC